MDVKLIERFEDLRHLQADWNRLVDAHPEASVFQRFEWIEAWWRIFGAGRDLYVLAVMDQDALVGLGPFYRHRRRWWSARFREIAFLGDEISDYGQVISEPGREAEVWKSLLRHFRARARDWDVVRLAEMPEQTYARWTVAVDGEPLLHGHRPASKTFILSTRQSWDAYWDSLSKRMKKKFRRQQKVLAGCRLETVAGNDITPALVETIADLNRQGPRNKLDGSLFLREPYRSLHWEQLWHSPLRPLLNLYLLWLGDRAVAYIYGFNYKQRLLEYNSNYDLRFRDISVGSFVHVAHVQHAFETDVEAVDFLRGDYDYKRNLLTAVNQNQEALLFRGPLLRARYQVLRWTGEQARRQYSRWLVPHKLALIEAGRKLRRLRERIRERGWIPFLRLGLNLAWKQAFIRRGLLITEVQPKEARLYKLPRPLGRDIEVRELLLADCVLLENFVGLKHLPMIIKRFWNGDRCWGAIRGGRVVGYGWTTELDQTDRQFQVRIKVEKDHIYLYDAFVARELRGLGLVVEMINLVLQDPAISKAKRLFALIRPENRAIRKTLERFSFRISGRILRWKFGWIINRQSYKPVSPNV